MRDLISRTEYKVKNSEIENSKRFELENYEEVLLHNQTLTDWLDDPSRFTQLSSSVLSCDEFA